MYELIRNDPVLLLFLVLGIGYVIGGMRIGSFKLGPVAGVLLAGLLLGHFGFEGNAAIQSFGFVMFIFSVGYQAGPKFVEAIQKDGRRYLLISVIVAVSGFLLAFIISLDDFIITNFVKGAGVETLPTAIFGSVKQGIKPNIMALSTLMLMVSILFVTISYFAGKSGAKSSQ